MLYTCPALVTSRHPMIIKTQHLVDIARRDHCNPPCYYLRGLQSTANTIPTTEPYWSADSIGQGANLAHWPGPIIRYMIGLVALIQVTPGSEDVGGHG
eukprot:1180593-Karenia_brevis.AAC.1